MAGPVPAPNHNIPINQAYSNRVHDLFKEDARPLNWMSGYAYQTRTETSALMAHLAVGKMAVDWRNIDAISQLRIVDFACGAGVLLEEVYNRISFLYSQSGGDNNELHNVIMENVLYGCDVSDRAIYASRQRLSNTVPGAKSQNPNLYLMAYGNVPDDLKALGSLDLVNSSSLYSMSGSSRLKMVCAVDHGELPEERYAGSIPDNNFDLVIMDPPHSLDSSATSNVDNKTLMNQMRLSDADANGYNGRAGIASAFAALAHRKLRDGGIVAMLLPVAAVEASTWAKFRRILATGYNDITVVNTAAPDGPDRALSSDEWNGSAECIMVARKSPANANGDHGNVRSNMVSLNIRPQGGWAAAVGLANEVASITDPSRIEDGPRGGTVIDLYGRYMGEVLNVPIDSDSDTWPAAGIADGMVAQAAYSLSRGKLWVPGMSEEKDLPMVRLDWIGNWGVDSQLLVSEGHNGPFVKDAYSSRAKYPSLWKHHAREEVRMLCRPDSQLKIRPGMKERAHQLWENASRCHLTRDVTFYSQILTVAFTEHAVIGGFSWPNVKFHDERFDYPFTLWCNSTLGILMYWWMSNRQQAGRGRLPVGNAGPMPVLDFRILTDEQLADAMDMFDEFKNMELKPIYVSDRDPNRALLDRMVLEWLGFGESIYHGVRALSVKLCAEPSVNGGQPIKRDLELAV